MLSLTLHQFEDGAIQESTKRVVVELSHWHLFHVVVIALDELLEFIEHLIGVTAAHDLGVVGISLHGS